MCSSNLFGGGGSSGGGGGLGDLLAWVTTRNASAPATPQAPELQAAKTPDQAAARMKPTSAAAGSAASTLLTGGAGIDNSLLSLGKTTLLGG